jgi:hypothetical protein
MRHCVNDDVKVYEETNENLGSLLRTVAEQVDKSGAFQNLNVDYDCDSAYYRATLYVHD